ncbi:Hypothetical protein DEACI_3006 [Acididesulfobacillus acetoxydans]|uniref:Uncharacterized protein n=1 Tax=Acididesulfobacillus acetoxydans TaxID=1561005 RepID=A0A8S0WGZ8_9FIRM|nr:hypothetical protein [Acididesulfobacillus acetoxydans]CAA7602332.1 Hypothetical protein DEACI_3006 [Acididesulfobacillus acetoxydans]CEJ08433.1 Hypothetical protein DEACI_2909 [Acididesulfobacillus acetoxydans]
MNTDEDEEHQTLRQLLDINRELLRVHQKRLMCLRLTKAQAQERMDPLVARYERLQTMLEEYDKISQ